MCLSYPVRILEMTDGPLPMGRINYGAEDSWCALAYVPEATVGDHVIVQNGFAIQVLDEQSASESLAAFAELGVG
ncbi:MAG: HypC/HybG/HupF family hydrogenase formation chaperone [Cellulomonadaceae bacterium]|nr:HypC/HybG/HupF family hydrogenase formation chaperone [Cellulomonadaceae bacterium]